MTTSQQAGTALAAAPGARESTASGDALVVEGLTCELPSPAGMVRPVDNVSFTLGHSKTLGIVGESGAGKSMLVRAMLGISPASATVSGKVILDGVDIRALPKKEHRHKLGAGISLIFQDPMTSLNPVVPIGRQITEGMRFHHGVDRGEAKDRAIELLRQVGISEPEKRFRQYPHQLSGGMRQRVTIAAALGCDPQVLIADEATTALDVTVQKQILDLLGQIQAERKMSVIIITHDLGIVAGRTNDLVVMYAGQVVEKGPTRRLFKMNRNRYTAALLEAMPDLENETHAKMNTIPGQPPRLTGLGARGCRFAPRCSAAQDDCRASDPELLADPTSEVHLFRCFHPVESAATANGGTPAAEAAEGVGGAGSGVGGAGSGVGGAGGAVSEGQG